jgi:gluconate kinase
MAARRGHFMPAALLDSQFSTLEEPSPDENPIVVDIGGRPEEIVGEIAERLRVAPSP